MTIISSTAADVLGLVLFAVLLAAHLGALVALHAPDLEELFRAPRSRWSR